MRFDQLTYFEILVQENSYHKASDKLHISQPALTNSIKSMEKELGITLLIRDSRGIMLTEEGKKMLSFSQTVTAMYQNLLNDFHDIQNTYSGNIAIFAPTFFSELILENFLPVLADKYPQLHLHLIESENDTSPTQIINTSCNFAIVSGLTAENPQHCLPEIRLIDDAFFDSNFVYLPLFQDSFGVSISKNSTLAAVSEFYPDTLQNVPFTAFRLGFSQYSENLILSSNNIQLHVKALTQSGAVTCLPYFAHKQYFAHETSIIWRPFHNNMTITYYLIYPIKHTLSTAEQKMIELLQQYLTQLNYK